MTLDEQFNVLNEKLQLLLKQQLRLRRENDQLKELLAGQKNVEANQKGTIEELKQQVSILKFAAGEMTKGEKKDFERKIDRYLKEIDNCIAFLGQ